MFLRASVAVFAATISLGLLSEACSGEEWPATELNVPPPSTDDDWEKDFTVVAIAPDNFMHQTCRLVFVSCLLTRTVMSLHPMLLTCFVS